MTRLDGQRSSLRNDIDTILSYYLPHPGKSVICVDSDLGSDANGQGSVKKPFKTLTYAESVSEAYDTIIAWGLFHEQVTIDVLGLRVLGIGPYISKWLGSAPNDDPVIIDNWGIEIAGFMIKYVKVGGITIDILKHGADIHHNLIEYNAMGSGMRLTDAQLCHIYRNHIYGGIAGGGNGILLRRGTSYCSKNRIIRNIIEGGDNGIYVDQTGGVGPFRNQILRNEIYDYQEYGIKFTLSTKNNVRDNHFAAIGALGLISGAKDQYISGNTFKELLSGTHTTVGAVEETVFTDLCPQPLTRVSGYLRLNNMVGGDDFIFRVLKSHDAGVNWDIIDETNLVGAQLIDRYNFDVTLEDADEQVTVTIDRQSGIDRSFFHKRTISDV